MTTDLAAALCGRFGPGGMRAYDSPELGGLPLPVQVGAYFIAAEREHPLTLGGFARAAGLTPPDPGLADRVRLGTDQGAELYVSVDGSVRAVFLGVDLPPMHVSRGVEAFAVGLLTLDQALPRIAGVDDPVDGFPVFRDLRDALLAIDPDAFADREAWWPRVLDDLRRSLDVATSAAFEVADADGERQLLTEVTRPGLPHPEELLWYRLSAAGIEADEVRRVYCDLEPCLMPGHYCALWMARMFPGAEFTHGFGYGDTAQSREDGVRGLRSHFVEQGWIR
jgi:hypothetical protein